MADSGNSSGWRRVGRHFSLLLWKNFLLARRTPIRTILEITLPVFFGFLLLAIRHIVTSENHSENTVYRTFSFDQLPPFSESSDPAPNTIAFAPITNFTTELMHKVAWNISNPDASLYLGGKFFENEF